MSAIEWTDETWNPVTGCTRVSTGCENCYAERLAGTRLRNQEKYAGLTRLTSNGPRWTGEIRLHESELAKPSGWRKPRRVFVCSMSDLFHEKVPDAFIADVFWMMHDCQRHTFQVLTKRPERAAALLDGSEVLPNVWLGTSVENQEAADERIPHLLKCPAVVRFLSCEPLLEALGDDPPVIGPYLRCSGCGHVGSSREFYERAQHPCCIKCGKSHTFTVTFIDWLICGGESGPGARPMHPDWARSLRDQCNAAGVPFFFKQWGEHLPVVIEDDDRFSGGRAFDNPSPSGGRCAAIVRVPASRPFQAGAFRVMVKGDETRNRIMIDDDTIAVRVGKKAAGRLLDGREWNEMPEGI